MKIGRQFNKKCELILLEAGKLSEMKSGVKITVEQVNFELGLEKNELRSYLEYMRDKNLIELITIGGPYLYGHICLTKTGLTKIMTLRRKQ